MRSSFSRIGHWVNLRRSRFSLREMREIRIVVFDNKKKRTATVCFLVFSPFRVSFSGRAGAVDYEGVRDAAELCEHYTVWGHGC